jgi:sulfate permease, SulP family
MSSEAVVVDGQPAAAAGKPSFISAGDLWGGLAAMLVAFPSAIAFGVVIFTAASPSFAGAGALAGIVGAASLGIIAPLVSRNRGFITAPCAPAAAVMSGLAAELAQHGHTPVARLLSILALTALVSAVLQITYGIMRVGRLMKFIPYQVVNGYLSGVAVIIAAGQIPKLLGASAGSHLFESMIEPRLWKWPGIVVGVVTIAAMSLAPKLTKKVPAAIVGLASGIAAYFTIAAFDRSLLHVSGNPLIIGPIRTEGSVMDVISVRLQSLPAITFADLALIIGPALTLSVLLSIDTLKTGVVLDALTRSRHNSNRELIAQGIANVGSFLTGGVPGSGTMGPTLVNVTSGGRSMWSSVIEGLLVLGGFVAFGRLMAWVPIGALAGILLVVAWRMFDFKMFRLLFTPGARLDFAVIAAVVIVSEAVGLIQAAVVGVFLAILIFIRNQIRTSVIVRKADLRELRSKRRRSPEENHLLDQHGGEGLFVQLKGDLFFGTTDQLFVDLEKDLAERRFILFDLRRVESMDYTAAHLLTQMQQQLRERGGRLLFAGLPSTMPSGQDIADYLGKLGVVSAGNEISIFDTRDSALEWMEDQILAAAGWKPVESRPPMELREFPLMQLDEDLMGDLERTVQKKSFKTGERVFHIGEAGEEIFLVRSGRVNIFLPLPGNKRHHLATMCRGDFFGEMSFLDKRARSADAEAATDTEIFIVARSAFDAIVKKDERFATAVYKQLARGIAERLRVTDAELRSLEVR